jgi:hypothetical protein
MRTITIAGAIGALLLGGIAVAQTTAPSSSTNATGSTATTDSTQNNSAASPSDNSSAANTGAYNSDTAATSPDGTNTYAGAGERG